MISTEPLERVLTAVGARELGFEDRSLEDILTLAGGGRYIQAAERAQQLWMQDIYDVRTLGCYLFGVFHERGIASLTVILECVLRALQKNLQYLGPVHKRERHLDVSLRWLFDSVITQVRFHEHQKDETWKRWNEAWQQAAHLQALARCRDLLTALDACLPAARCRQPLLNLQSILEVLARESAISSGWTLSGATQIPAPPPPPDPTEPASDSDGDSSSSDEDKDDDDDDKDDDDKDDDDKDDDKDDDDEDDDEDDEDKESDKEDGDKDDEDEDDEKEDDKDDDKDDDKEDDDKDDDKDADDNDSDDKDEDAGTEEEGAGGEGAQSPAAGGQLLAGGSSPSGAAAGPAAAGPGVETLQVPISPALRELLQQLAGFVQLVEKRRYRRAAILHQQIRQALTGFDPARYFPGLFGDFLVALLRHAKSLKPLPAAEAATEDLEHQALCQLCRVDLQRFLQGSDV